LLGLVLVSVLLRFFARGANARPSGAGLPYSGNMTVPGMGTGTVKASNGGGLQGDFWHVSRFRGVSYTHTQTNAQKIGK